MTILEIDRVTKDFGGLRAVHDFSLSIEEGELVGLIGPNGAGKTTIFNMISGFYLPTSGDMRFRNTGIVGLEPHQVANLGVGRTFQNIRLFGSMSLLDNVRTAFHSRAGYGIFGAMLRNGHFMEKERDITERAHNLLEVVGLDDRADDRASALPYGDRRRLEIARALATRPTLLLLDEPAAGMNPHEVGSLMNFVVSIKEKFDLTVLLIEHHMRVVMGICERIAVISFGEIIGHGTPREVRKDPAVIKAYLGH